MSDAAQAEQKKIAGRAGIVALGTLSSRMLGLVRDSALAALFSRGATDAFLVAFQLPNLLRQLLAEGAVQNAVLPVLTKIRVREGDEAARRYFRAIRGLGLVASFAVAVLGIFLAPWMVDLFAPGFRERPEQFELTVLLSEWLFPYIFFMSAAALGVAALNTHGRFVASSFSPGLLNVSFVLFAFALPAWLSRHGHPPILAMAFAALVGGVLQVLAQWPSLRRIGYLEAPSWEPNHPGVHESLKRMAPTLFGIGVYYIDVVVGRRLLSELGEGPISYFGFALRVCDFPQGIFVMALQTATLPSLAAFVARGDHDSVGRTFAFAMRLSLFVGFAATALFVVLAEPIVSLLFQRGQFDLESTRETGRALVAQGLGIFLVAGVRQLVAVFFALGDTRTPVMVAALDLLAFVGLALALRGPFGHVGVGLAVSGSSLVQFLLLWILLSRRLPSLHSAEILRSALGSLLHAGLAAAAAWAVVSLSGIDSSASAWLRALPALLGSGVFVVVFLTTCSLTRNPELGAVVGPLRARFARKR
ncbi:MAG TPA: murein biosynthesis integral membrane protein MurJ [Polyangiaceae bacterium]|nr:murein biosynthesis integral membrane protein MurJ [Polyangiaceae bacterium]